MRVVLALLWRSWAHYSDFSGRSRRSEYWLFLLLRWAVVIGLFGSLSDPGGDHPLPGYGLHDEVILITVTIWFLATLVPAWAVTVRRLHDANQSGAWSLVCLIPYAGLAATLTIGLLPGTPGENDKGFDPRIPDSLHGLEDTFA